MYSDYGNLAFQFENYMHELEREREKQQRVREALSRAERQPSLLSRLMQTFGVRRLPEAQADSDTQRAPAL